MTPEQAKEIIESRLSEYKRCYPQGGEYVQALEMAVKALEEKAKYRWHDLRKNPEDLPKEDGVYMVCQFNNNNKIKSYTDLPLCDDGSFCTPWYMPVIAWREIEPFESEGD